MYNSLTSKPYNGRFFGLDVEILYIYSLKWIRKGAKPIFNARDRPEQDGFSYVWHGLAMEKV
jgi:hypothetical protein